MRRPNPRHRFEALQRKLVPPDTDTERSLYVLLHGPEALGVACPLRPWSDKYAIDGRVLYPYEVFQDEMIRAILEAFLMASEDDLEVANALSMFPDEVHEYRKLFFDTAVFKSQLERIVFMREIPDDNPSKGLYNIAMRQGFEALRWHCCQDKGSVEPNEVLKTIMMDSYFRSLEHRGNLPTTKLAREAAKYAKLSIECARALIAKSENAVESTESLRMQFEEVRTNRTIEDLQREVGLERVMH